MLNLASFLLTRGERCDIVDTAFEEVDWNKIKQGHYFLVGISILIGDFMKNARELSAKIKEIAPDLPICLGGVMASLVPGQLLSDYNVDFVIRFEGEYSLFELVRCLKGKGSLKNIRGLSYKKGSAVVNNPPRTLETNLDNFPVPRWSLFGSNINQKQMPYYFSIMTSKGCPFKCSFCYNHSVDEEIRNECPVWRCRTADHVIAELKRIHKSTNTRVFTFGDDNFLVEQERALKIFNFMKENNFYVEQCIAHVNNLSDGLIDAMEGVVQTVIYAIESASPALLKLLNKNIDLSRIPDTNEKLFDKSVTTIHNFIVGLPTETDEDLRLNVELMLKLKKINPYVRAVAFLYLPLPFTPLNSYIENEMGLPLPHTLRDYEEATFDSGTEQGRKFRPWLSKEKYDFLHKYCLVFDDAFRTNNMSLSSQSEELLAANPKLKDVFRGIKEASRPKAFYAPYVLDRVLSNEKVALTNLKELI